MAKPNRGGKRGVGPTISPELKQKYRGRFADGTAEQLDRAERNLTFNIERTKQAIASAKYMTGVTKAEHLAHHNDTLRELMAQMAELQTEKRKRTK